MLAISCILAIKRVILEYMLDFLAISMLPPTNSSRIGCGENETEIILFVALCIQCLVTKLFAIIIVVVAVISHWQVGDFINYMRLRTKSIGFERNLRIWATIWYFHA